jgi:hypothetical protein
MHRACECRDHERCGCALTSHTLATALFTMFWFRLKAAPFFSHNARGVAGSRSLSPSLILSVPAKPTTALHPTPPLAHLAFLS